MAIAMAEHHPAEGEQVVHGRDEAACAGLDGRRICGVATRLVEDDALSATNAASGDAASFWAACARQWTAWNHVRTISGIVAAALFLIAMSLSSF